MIKYEEDLKVEDLKILEKWREYYQNLTKEEDPGEGRNEQQAEVEGGIRKNGSKKHEECLLVLYCINISLTSYMFVTTKLTTSPSTHHDVVWSMLRQYAISYRQFVVLSMVSQYIHVLPANRIDDKMKGWTDRTKRRTHKQ